MDDERWQALVRRLEPQARARPAAYRRKVLVLAALGYAFIGLLLLLLIASAALVVGLALKGHAILLLKLLIPIGAVMYVVARSLYVKLTPPEGIRLGRKQAPRLFEMIDGVRRAIRGPRIHDVRINGDTNASVVQVPRLGGIFGSRNYLVLGLPYLNALSAEQLRAVVAHELGHLSRAHGRFGAFVYRVRETWFRLLQGLERRDSAWTSIVRRFFFWYVPYFSAYTLPLVRAHEFEADEAAAAIAGREQAGGSLVRAMLVARWAEESYWPGIFRRALHEPVPPETAFAPLAEQIGEAGRDENVGAWYRSMLAVETGLYDTHPSLRERLEHLGLDPDGVLALAQADGQATAAAAYLGEAEAPLVAAVDRAWHEQVTKEWHERHSEAVRDERELQRLEASEVLSLADELRRAQLTEIFRSQDDAFKRYRALLGSEQDVPARFAMGRLLLEREDDEGLRLLEDAMVRDPEAVLPACQVAYAYLLDHGREDEAERYRRRGEEQMGAFEQAAGERSGVSVDDRLEPADLPGELLSGLREKVAWHEEVEEAYLVRKRTEQFDETHPFYVLAVVPKSGLRAAWKETDHDSEPLVDRVARELALPGGEVIVAKIDRKSPLGRRFAEIDGARLYARE